MLKKNEVLGLDHALKFKTFSFLDKKTLSSENFQRSCKAKCIFENDFFAVVYKPSAMPTAPLKKDEEGTLLSCFLQDRPEASSVKGRKEIEAGLIHRLDTPTSGLVLIAKTQSAYDVFIDMQEKNRIEKRYIAICDIDEGKISHEDISRLNFPKEIESQFRPFGPKARMVAPVFPDHRLYKPDGQNYTSKLLSLEALPGGSSYIAEIALRKGYRHQIRSHLASLGLAIKNDALYNPKYVPKNKGEIEKHNYLLELHAVSIILHL